MSPRAVSIDNGARFDQRLAPHFKLNQLKAPSGPRALGAGVLVPRQMVLDLGQGGIRRDLAGHDGTRS